MSVLTILVLLIGSVYCFYCLFDDWRQSQAGLPSQMAKFKPDADDPLSFEELLKLNPDVIGWITIDKTHIDQRGVQRFGDFRRFWHQRTKVKDRQFLTTTLHNAFANWQFSSGVSSTPTALPRG